MCTSAGTDKGIALLEAGAVATHSIGVGTTTGSSVVGAIAGAARIHVLCGGAVCSFCMTHGPCAEIVGTVILKKTVPQIFLEILSDNKCKITLKEYKTKPRENPPCSCCIQTMVCIHCWNICIYVTPKYIQERNLMEDCNDFFRITHSFRIDSLDEFTSHQSERIGYSCGYISWMCATGLTCHTSSAFSVSAAASKQQQGYSWNGYWGRLKAHDEDIDMGSDYVENEIIDMSYEDKWCYPAINSLLDVLFRLSSFIHIVHSFEDIAKENRDEKYIRILQELSKCLITLLTLTFVVLLVMIIYMNRGRLKRRPLPVIQKNISTLATTLEQLSWFSKETITEYERRLDTTLACSDLQKGSIFTSCPLNRDRLKSTQTSGRIFSFHLFTVSKDEYASYDTKHKLRAILYSVRNKKMREISLDQPGYIVRNPELRIKESTETRAIQEGAGAFNGQAQLDPTHPDDFESVIGVGVDVLHGNKSHLILPLAEVEENGAQAQHLSEGYAISRRQAPVVPVATPATVLSMLDDLKEPMHFGHSGFRNLLTQQFSVGTPILVSSKGHFHSFTHFCVQFSTKTQLKVWNHPLRDCLQMITDKTDEMVKGQLMSKFSSWPILAMTVNPRLKRLKRSVGEANAVLSSLKRKELQEDWDCDRIVKRRRNVRIARLAKPIDDYDEDLKAFSLLKKKLVSVAMVNFLSDVKVLNRMRRLLVISEHLNEILESTEMIIEHLEDLESEIVNPVHKGPTFYNVGFVSRKDVLTKIPGLVNSDKLSFGKFVPLIQHSPEKGYIFSKVSNAVKITQQDVAHNQEEREWTSSENVIFKDQTLEEALTDVEEEVGNETTGVETCARKKLEIRIQECPSEFEKQSDVTSISKDNLQNALTTVRSDTFVNFAKRNVQGSSCKQDKVHFRCNQPRFNEKETPFENTEVALLRELTCVKNVELPDPQIDFDVLLRAVQVFRMHEFEPVMAIIDQIANGTPPTPHVSMRYELLRFCTLRSYPKENKPYLIRLAEAGFYYASDSDGVVCYCCGTRRYNWVAKDDPMKVHQQINPDCKFLKKNEEVNVPVKYFGPYSEKLMYIMSIPEPVERPQVSEDVNNDWAPERIRSPAPVQQNRENDIGASSLGINTAIPKHAMYATKTTREASYNGWPDSSSHTPQELSDAGFFYAGFGDCVRCFYCGIGLRHWATDDNPWIEHARWSRNCVYLRQKKGDEFVNLVQFALQFSQKEAEAEQSNASGNQVPVLDVEKILLSDAAQIVLEMGYPPSKIKRALEEILRLNGNVKITASALMQKVLEMEEGENQSQSAPAPAPTPKPAATATPQTAESSAQKEIKANTAKGKTEGAAVSNTNTNGESKGSNEEAKLQDPKAIKAENELLKEQTLCKVCLDNTVCIVFLPCGHLVTCADCAPAMRKCPICRALVKGTVRTYMS